MLGLRFLSGLPVECAPGAALRVRITAVPSDEGFAGERRGSRDASASPPAVPALTCEFFWALSRSVLVEKRVDRTPTSNGQGFVSVSTAPCHLRLHAPLEHDSFVLVIKPAAVSDQASSADTNPQSSCNFQNVLISSSIKVSPPSTGGPDPHKASRLSFTSYRLWEADQLLFKEEFGHSVGSHIWISSIVLVAFLRANIHFILPVESRSCKMLELGTGTGYAGIALANLFSKCILTDRVLTLPFTRTNIALNAMSNVQACELDWGKSEQIEEICNLLDSQLDVVIAADVLYDRAGHSSFLSLLTRLSILRPSFSLRGQVGNEKVIFFVAQQKRIDSCTLEVMHKAQALGFLYQRVHSHQEVDVFMICKERELK